MESKYDDNRWFWLFLIINALMGFLYLILTASCTSAKSTTESETISQQIEQSSTQQSHINIVRDTIHTHDSVIIRQKNDTVYFDRWHVTYRAQRIADTVFLAVHDSIVRCDTVRLQQTTTIEPKPRKRGFWRMAAICILLAVALIKFRGIKQNFQSR